MTKVNNSEKIRYKYCQKTSHISFLIGNSIVLPFTIHLDDVHFIEDSCTSMDVSAGVDTPPSIVKELL